jgi:hypothetical protein
MPGLRACLAIPALLLLSATPGRAALLSLLGSSTLDVEVGPLGGERVVQYDDNGFCGGGSFNVAFPPLRFQMNTSGVLVSAPLAGGFVEPGGLFTGTRTQTIPFGIQTFTTMGQFCSGSLPPFASPPDITIANVSNSTKSIAPGAAGGGHAGDVVRPGGGLGGPGALAGTFFINVLGLFNLEVPLSPVGATGATGQFVAGSLVVTVMGTGWTTATVQVTGVSTVTTPTSNGAVLNTVTFAGYDNRTPGHVGRVLLVSPFKVITNAAGNLPGIARQTLDFAGIVPEPGTLGLLVAGAAGLALQGWRKLRR